MILLTHIIIALAGLTLATYIVFKPSKKLIKVTYGLTGATLVSGGVLVATSSSAHILQSTITGLAYVCLVSVGIVIAQVRLARTASDS